MFIFNNNKPQLDFMFSEDNVLVGKKKTKKNPFKRYFSFKQIHYGKYFFVHLIFSIKASVCVHKQAYHVHFTEAIILRKSQKTPVSLHQQSWILETGYGGFSYVSFPIFGQISKGRHSRPDLHFIIFIYTQGVQCLFICNQWY